MDAPSGEQTRVLEGNAPRRPPHPDCAVPRRRDDIGISILGQASARSTNGVSSVTVATVKAAGTQTICSGVASDIALAAIGQIQAQATRILNCFI
ncbi:hypothetical protein XH89_25675 [Bradyrhizobium sp. CCBAU 53340]|nr:hypothetical protein XH89_25675 [Bradyrhizobium sp. CCBAU 53340]